MIFCGVKTQTYLIGFERSRAIYSNSIFEVISSHRFPSAKVMLLRTISYGFSILFPHRNTSTSAVPADLQKGRFGARRQ